jgi:HSP20 family molecular chaperone IbpA
MLNLIRRTTMGFLTLGYDAFEKLFDPHMDSVWPWRETSESNPFFNVSITKTKEAAYIHVNAIGFRKEEVSVKISGNILIVTGKLTIDGNNGRAFFSKNFEYSWTLGEHDLDKIESKLENGILTITVPFKMPKKEEEKKRLIEVK